MRCGGVDDLILKSEKKNAPLFCRPVTGLASVYCIILQSRASELSIHISVERSHHQPKIRKHACTNVMRYVCDKRVRCDAESQLL
jgi:hypothetical protein